MVAKTMCSPPPSALMAANSCHSNRSTSSFGSLMSVSVRKNHPSDKAGLQLEQDSNGQIVVTDISENGLFANTDLEVGDIILSVNKMRLSQEEYGPQVLMHQVHRSNAISIAVKKANSLSSSERSNRSFGPPVVMTPKSGKKKRRPSMTNNKKNRLPRSGSYKTKNSHEKEEPQDNNISRKDTYWGGMARHNVDGSLRPTTAKDLSRKSSTMTRTISASKPRPSSPTSVALHGKTTHNGGRLPIKSKSKLERKLSKKKTPRSYSGKSRGSSKKGKKKDKNEPCVGLTLNVKDQKLIVVDISPNSIFRSTKLRVGDIILSINDMSFRRHADADYATTIMESARLMVTLVVESSSGDDNDDFGDDHVEEKVVEDDDSAHSEEDDDDTDSLSSFGGVSTDYDDDGWFCSDEEKSLTDFLDSAPETEFKKEKLRTVTICVPKTCRSQPSGLDFRILKTKLPGLHNPTLSHQHPEAPVIPPSANGASTRAKKETWVYVSNIQPDSIFRKTSLKKGDKVLSINNVDLRENPDSRKAYHACSQSQEAIAMVVLRDDHSVYKERGFSVDRPDSAALMYYRAT